MAPLFEVRMELRDDGVRYQPSLEEVDEDSFLKLVESLVTDIYTATSCIPRLLQGKLSYKVGPQWAGDGQRCPVPSSWSLRALPVSSDHPRGAGSSHQHAAGGGVTGGPSHDGGRGVQCWL